MRISDGDITHQLDITLDPATWLPVKTASISLADPAHPVASETVNAEWETVQEIRFVRRCTAPQADNRAIILATDMDSFAGRTLTHYQLLEKFGEGGMGVVYKARDAPPGRLLLPRVLARAIPRLMHLGPGLALSGGISFACRTLKESYTTSAD